MPFYTPSAGQSKIPDAINYKKPRKAGMAIICNSSNVLHIVIMMSISFNYNCIIIAKCGPDRAHAYPNVVCALPMEIFK